MKTKLLNQNHLWSLALITLCYGQISFAQDEPNNSSANGNMQSFTLEYINLDGLDIARELQLSFSEITSDGFDEGYDNENLNVLNNDLNLTLDGDLMSQQAYGPINEDKVVPMVLRSTGTDNFTIQLTSMNNMGNQNISLRDNHTGNFFDLRSGETFEFSSASGSFTDRFQIFFKTQTLTQSDFDLESIDVAFIMDSGKLIVSNPSNISIENIAMYSISGQLVFNHLVNEDKSSYLSYSINDISTGIYIVKLVTETNSIFTKKVIAK